MNPTLEQLARYIAQELERGIPLSTLHTALLQRGWTADWIEAAIRVAKQQAAPNSQSSAPQMPQTETALPQPAQPAWTPPEQPASPPREDNREVIIEAAPNRVKAFIILGIILAVLLTIGIGAYFIVTNLNKAEAARLARDISRKDDLSIMLSDLSDYYVAHSSYPTREQLGDKRFLNANGFNNESVSDPQWSASESACTKDGKPVLAKTPAIHCYAYESSGSQKEVCNNDDRPCTRMRLTILLEKEKQPNVVTFDKNSELEE